MSRQSLLRLGAVVALASAAVFGLTGCITIQQTVKPTPSPTHAFGSGDSTAAPTALPTSAPVTEPTTAPTSSGFTFVVDDTQHVGVSVPDTWTETDGASFTDKSGNTWASITASTSLDGYRNSWTTSGVQVAATAIGNADPANVLTQLSDNYNSNCTPDGTNVAYSDPYYAGQYSTWDNCAGTTSGMIVLTATDLKQTHVIVMIAQLVTAEERDTVLTQLTNSFQESF